MADRPKRQFKVGDKILVNMYAGKIVDARIRAVIERTDGLRLQIDFDDNRTALIQESQVVDD
ncbi:MAG: hypothetical protein WBL63_14635 [Candidatus Acidiferrum sp.]